MSGLIATGSEWTFDLLEKFDAAIAAHADRFGLDTYPSQLEIITSEQMLDAYSTSGLPMRYAHWSFGKDFIVQEQRYRRGFQALAYEIVINSNPCIAYLMEENTLPMQALVIAHACYGHNAFFKNNFLFQQWTQANAIIDYLAFAHQFIHDCEQRYGIEEVEETLDSCHALADHGVYKYKRSQPISPRREAARLRERMAFADHHYNELWRTLPSRAAAAEEAVGETFPGEPEENLLYFIEKYSPILQPWQRELVRIVRKVAQYFYPQRQTKVMNEGFATFWHYTLLNTLYEHKQVNEGFIFEMLHSHTGVIYQPPFESKYFSGINPYALGFAMFSDIRRICEHPTAEDRAWFPDLAGSDWVKAIDFAMRNYRDESFILQYLSPKLMRDFRLFAIADHEKESEMVVAAIHNDGGYRRVRQILASQYRLENTVPDIQVMQFKRDKDRSLVLHHRVHRGRTLDGTSGNAVMKHLARLWGFPVLLEEVGNTGESITYLRAEP